MEMTLQLLINHEDDEVVFLEPFYSYHFAGMKFRGLSVFSTLTLNKSETEFELNFEDLANKINSRTKAIVICNPNNPTAKVFTEEEYIKISEIIAPYKDLVVIEDAAYCVYVNEKVNLKYFHEIGDNFSRTLTIYSGGKIFNTTGMRVGWIIGPEKIIKRFLNSYTDHNSSSCIDQKVMEYALKEALEPFQDFPNFWAFIADDINKRTDYTISKLREIEIPVVEMQGTYYIIINISRLVDRVEPLHFYDLSDKTIFDGSRDKAVARKLIADYKIAVLPISSICHITPKDDRFVRLVINRNMTEINMVLDALKDIISKPPANK
jgi:aspartate/methionine/tyrosine aminotransferase